MKKKILVFFVLFILWFSVCAFDFIRVTQFFQKPFFCLLTESADDGGSGKYFGLGYSFEIEGNFMPEDQFPGVTEYEASILWIPVASGIRN